MYSIGELSKRSNVKVPTIRYYEEIGLIKAPERTEGNQRRYGADGLELLNFIKHARDLGFSIEAITSLIELQDHPDRSCEAATSITIAQLSAVREKIKQLRALEKELVRISKTCAGSSVSSECHLLASLADHSLCRNEH